MCHPHPACPSHRAEHDALQHRAANQRLREEVEAMQGRESARCDEVLLLQAAAEAARASLQAQLDGQVAREVELARARHDGETDDILVVSLQRGGEDDEGILEEPRLLTESLPG